MDELKAVIEILQTTVYANPKANIFISCIPPWYKAPEKVVTSKPRLLTQ